MTYTGAARSREVVQKGFTIVEVITVIVVIGILAAVTLVTYNGISQRAIAATMQNDLNDAAGQLKLYQAENFHYPNSVTDCPSPAVGNMCLKTSSGNVVSSFSKDNTAFPQKFNLTLLNTGMLYKLTEKTSQTFISPAPTVSSNAPVADWIAVARGDHYGTFYDLVGKQFATVNRSTPKTIYDPSANHIYDVPVNYIGINPRSDGKSGAEALIEDSRSNYLTNSYFATDSDSDGRPDNYSYWANQLPPLSGAYSSVAPVMYNKSNAHGVRVQVSGVASAAWGQVFDQYTSVGTFAPTDNCTASIWYKGTATGTVGVRLSLAANNSSNGWLSDTYSNLFILDGSWHRANLTYANLPAATSSVQFVVGLYGNASGGSIDLTVEAAQVEKGAFATSYIPTTTTALTRNYDSVNVPTSSWNPDTFTYVAVANMPPIEGGEATAYLLRWDSNSTNDLNQFDINWYSNWFNTTLQLGRVGSWPWSAHGGTYSPGQYHTYTGSSTPSGWERMYIDSVRDDPDDSPALPNTMRDPESFAKIGSGTNWAAFNSPIQRIVIYNSQLNDADTTTVTNAVKDGY